MSATVDLVITDGVIEVAGVLPTGPRGPVGPAGIVEAVVAGPGVSVDSTDPANPVVAAEVTQAALAAHAADTTNIHGMADTAALLDTGDIGTTVQAHSAVLDATTASFTTADETKLDHITVTQAVDLDTIEVRVNSLDAAVVLRGSWDASTGSFPGGGTAQAGDSYIVSAGGTVDGQVFTANDRIVALVDDASTATYTANWLKLDYTDAVLSVNGQTGTVVLAKADVGLGNVDNTADSAKPVSTAQQTALDAKADAAALDAHEADTTNVHGIADTLALLDTGDIGTTVQAHSAVLDATTAAFTVADEAKLDGIDLSTKADLVGGVVPTAQMPAITIMERAAVADEAARLALTNPGDVQVGDVAVQADTGTTWLLVDADPSLAGSWKAIDQSDAVQSVNGQTGTVVLAKADVGLGNVDNTADSAKPVSTAQQAALDAKADASALDAHVNDTADAHDASAVSYAGGTGMSATDVEAALDELATEKLDTATAASTYAPLISPALIGIPTVPTAAPGTNTTQAASTAFVNATSGVAALVRNRQNLRRWAAALGDAYSNAAVQPTIAWHGDSITGGAFSGNSTTTVPAEFRANGFLPLLSRMFETHFGDAGEGFVFPGTDSVYYENDRVTAVGVSSAVTVGPHKGGMSMNAGDSLTFAIDTPCTQIDIMAWWADGVSAPFTYTVDGGASQDGPTKSGSDTLYRHQVTGLAETAHTLVIHGPATLRADIGGIVCRNDRGVLVHRIGKGGSTIVSAGASDFSAASQARVINSSAVLLDPDLTVLMFGHNDANAGITAATFEANIDALADATIGNGGCVLLVPDPESSLTGAAATLRAEYVQTMKDYSDTTDHVSFLNFDDVWGGYTAANGLGIYQDTVHPNSRGHGWMARIMFDVLMSAQVGAAA